jgi:hypothetical protein
MRGSGRATRGLPMSTVDRGSSTRRMLITLGVAAVGAIIVVLIQVLR